MSLSEWLICSTLEEGLDYTDKQESKDREERRTQIDPDLLSIKGGQSATTSVGAVTGFYYCYHGVSR